MRTIMVLNAKGGCGKSTISTNLASYYAWEKEQNVVLADYDPQGSSMAWLQARGEEWPPIQGIAAWKDPVKAPRNTDVVIMDAPARVHGKELTQLIRKAETILLPILPSPIDMRAATDYIAELKANSRVANKQVVIGVVANRIRENTVIFQELSAFLKKIKLPVVASLRDTQNYIRAEQQGIGIFEMPPHQVWHDVEDWQSLTRWLNSKRSRP